MAQHTITTLIDDVDGSEAAETVTFGLDRRTYEIDLKSEHAAQLRDSLEMWVSHARLIGAPRGRQSAASNSGAAGPGRRRGRRGRRTAGEAPNTAS